MILVATETSSTRGSLSIYNTKESRPLAETFWLRDRSHSEVILSEYDKLLKQAQLQCSQIDAYAVGLGPGSFTGLRVGVNFVKTMAYSFNKPVYGLSSLQILAEDNILKHDKCLCLINAFRNLIYCAGYKRVANKTVCWLKPQALSAFQLDALVESTVQCLGNGYEAFESQFSPELKPKLMLPTKQQTHPKAESLARIIAQDPSLVTRFEWREVKPLYIRASEAEEKLRRN